MRSRHGGCVKDKVQIIISTNVTISATICHRHLVLGTCHSASLWTEHLGAYMGAYSQARLGVHCKACSAVCLRASWELTWKYTVKQAGSVLSSAIGSVLKAHFGMYSQAGWECAIECNWEHLESLFGNVQPSRLGVCHQVQLIASWELTRERAIKCIS